MGAVDALRRQTELLEDLAPAVLRDDQYRLGGRQRGKEEPAIASIRVEVREQCRRAVRNQIQARDHWQGRRLQEEIEGDRVVDLRGPVEDLALAELGERIDRADPERLEGDALLPAADEDSGIRRQAAEELHRVHAR